MKKNFALAAVLFILLTAFSGIAAANAANEIIGENPGIGKAVETRREPRADDGVYHCFAPGGALIYSAVWREPDLTTADFPPSAKSYLRYFRQKFFELKSATDEERQLYFPMISSAFAESKPYNYGYSKNNLPKKGDLAKFGEYFAFVTEIKKSPGAVSLVTTKTVCLTGNPRTQETFAATFKSDGGRVDLDEFLNRADAANAVAKKLLEILAKPPYKENLSADWKQHLFDFCNNPLGDGWYAENGNLVIICAPHSIFKTDETTVVVPLAQLLKTAGN